METEEAKLKEFSEEFFKSLNCKISWDKEVMIVENVPATFEKYYGKSSPYKIVFDRLKEKEGYEVITKGSYLLKAMTSYLEKSGETTLLKLDFKINPEEEIKKRINLINCEITRLSKKKKYDYFSRFTFLTTFQYMNGKEQLTNDIYVYDGKVIKGNLESYEVSEGDKKDITIENIDEAYLTAKEQLKNLLNEKTSSISKELEEKLQKEIYRIEKHFKQKIKEMEEAVTKASDKRKVLELQLGYGDDEEIKAKLKKLDAEIEGVNKDGIDTLEKEKDHEVKIELYKHSLNISNKLINTTIIYYPLLAFDLVLKNSTSNRMVEVNYNPLTNEMKNVFCDSCSKKVEDLLLDGAGHLICKECVIKCGNCEEIHCKKCLIKKCSLCEKNICLNCAVKCSACGKDFCEKHVRKDATTEKHFCLNCLSRCDSCGEYFKSTSSEKKKTKNVCQKCLSKEVQKKTLKKIFN